MRACLHTLQFLARRCERVRLADVEGAAVGHKDVTRSAFSLWQQLLSGKVRSTALSLRSPSEIRVHHGIAGMQ